jgi:hypothetical protein
MTHPFPRSAGTLRLVTALLLAIAIILPSRAATAQEITVSALCGWGYAGTFNYPDDTAYTLKNAGPLCITWLECAYYEQGTGDLRVRTPVGWSVSGQVRSIQYSSSVTGKHRLCNEDQSICSVWGFTSDS